MWLNPVPFLLCFLKAHLFWQGKVCLTFLLCHLDIQVTDVGSYLQTLARPHQFGFVYV